MRPHVSIITPTYRHQNFIGQCLRSVLAQTYTSWELLVIDDASPDETVRIVEQFVRKDPRIQLIRHETNYGAAGLSGTYNEALSHCRGDLVAVLEGDDEWVPCKLAEQVQRFADSRVILCYADYDEVTHDGRPITSHGRSAAPASSRSGLLENLRFFSLLKSFGANTVVVRRRALQLIGGFVDAGVPLVDYPTWLRLSFEGEFVRVPLVLGRWRRHPNSVYWAAEYATLERLQQYFLNLLAEKREKLLALGLTPGELDELARNPARALSEKLRNRPYFEGKYQLVMGRRLKAIGPFSRALFGPSTSLRHRGAAFLGMLAAATSPRLLLSLSRLGRNPEPDGR